MKKGNIWRVHLPFRPGHVQSGDRPAVIVQDDPITAGLPTVLVVPFTSNRATLRYTGTVLVQPDGKNGLTMPSVALVFQLVPVDKRDFLRFLGRIDGADLDDRFTSPSPVR